MRVRIRAGALSARDLGLLCGVMIVAGCGGTPVTVSPVSASIRGAIHGGQQPVSGSTVQLYAAGNSGYGTGAQALLSTGVTTDQYGNFNIPHGA